jgi:phage gpG-like protein
MPLYTEVTFKPPLAAQELIADIKAIEARMQNCVPVFSALQPKVVEMHKQHFEDAIHPSKWVLKASTIKKKKRLGYPLTPLVRTGKMRSKIGDWIPAPTPYEMRVGTTGHPARVHHYGVPKGAMPGKPNYELPARQYIGVTEDEAMRVRTAIHGYITTGKVDVSGV